MTCRAVLLLSLAAAVWPAAAQKLNPVQWSFSLEPDRAAPGGSVLGRLTARIDPGWHLYSLSTPKGGPIATTVALAPHAAVSGVKIHQPKPARNFDPNFKLDTESYEKRADFLLEISLARHAASGHIELVAQARFQCCDDKMCLPPRRITAPAELLIDPAAPPAQVVIPAGYTEFGPGPPAAPPAAPAAPPAAPAQTPVPQQQGLALFLVVAFGFGLAAIFTPCVFPMIPITLSYFLNRPAGERRQGLSEAAVFCLGVIGLFTALGLAATAALGPFGVVQLGSSVWVNSFIAAVFLVFGVSLLGAFEITLPSGLLTRLDKASRSGGLIGALVMGLTFTLAAFACVGPFMGTLLAASLSGGGTRPLLGMLAFASGLALPFFFLALFPSYLKRLPRSGGWMERIKVVMGLVILAVMVKYVTAIDQVMQWGVLTRERFLAVWIVLFGMAGCYLLGWLRLHGSSPEESVGTGRLVAGVLFLAFAVSLAPGMFGARLGELDAYVPPARGAGELGWMRNQYGEALSRARRENRRVLAAFTGYACTNCHWMKANLFTRPEVDAAMRDFVLVELYTDGTDGASAANQRLQESKFSTIAIPYYAILDADAKVIATFPGLTRDTGEFLAFLRRGGG